MIGYLSRANERINDFWLRGNYKKHIIKNANAEQREANRKEISKSFIKGRGLELGAAHAPLYVDDDVKIKYVDIVTAEQTSKWHPELQGCRFVEVDILDDGEILSKVENHSQDFIIANHFLEHTRDPIGTIKKHISKLKEKGILYYAVPRKEYTFDRDRKITTFKHLLNDYNHGGTSSLLEHYEDWVRKIDKVNDENTIKEYVKRLVDLDSRIHFHVWDTDAFEDFILKTRRILGSFDIDFWSECENEVIVVLRKR